MALSVQADTVRLMADSWVARFDEHPTKRIAFGSVAAAAAFVDQVPGWSVIDNDSAEWLPLLRSLHAPAE